jgi:preprotein translocase subunit SecE
MSTTASSPGGGSSEGSFWPELFRFGLYKPNQGKIVRQITFFALALLSILLAYEMYAGGWLSFLNSETTTAEGLTTTGLPFAKYGVSGLIAAIGIWVSYRVVNYSKFGDFLIAVEAEMNKVSWPTKEQLYRASVVVIFVIFAMAAALFLFDIIWTVAFEAIGIRYSDENSMLSRIVQFFGF